MAAVSVLQLVLVIGPQLALALYAHSRFRVVLFGAMGLFWVVLPLVYRRFSPRAVTRLLAYHGVSAEGVIREPVSAWDLSPFGRLGFVLLMAQVLLVASGGAIVYDRLEARSHCEVASPQVLSRLNDLLGKPGIAPGFGPAPSVPIGARLVRAKQVDQGLAAITYLTAYAQVPGRPDVGPGVWRVIVPGGVFPVGDIDLSSANGAARALTPTLGYISSTPPDPRVHQAIDCLSR